MYTPLYEHIRKYLPFTDADAAALEPYLYMKEVKRKEILLKPGQVCREHYFVKQGLVRMYLLDEKDTEKVTTFALENWWVTDNDSFITGKPSEYHMQAVEAGELIYIKAAERDEMFKAVPAYESYTRMIAERALVAYQRRVNFINMMSDEERYRFFAESFPGFLQRVPQYMLASYLGFTPQFMSKIRAKR